MGLEILDVGDIGYGSDEVGWIGEMSEKFDSDLE